MLNSDLRTEQEQHVEIHFPRGDDNAKTAVNSTGAIVVKEEKHGETN